MLSTLGSIIGRGESVEEPPYEVIFKHKAEFEYEIRKYGERYAAETHYTSDDDSPFMVLARYIGVFGSPENEGQQAISMTAPVVKESKPTAIAMTAPVVKSEDESGEKTMEFMLPAEFDSLEKIPRPTNPRVHIREIPPAYGAVHRYSGSMGEEKSREMATDLALQLSNDGVDMDASDALENYQFWGYNPPFTLPMFRRNEVWIELSEDQVDHLVNGIVVHKAN